MSYQVPLGFVPISSSALRPLGAAYILILLSEVEQEQKPSGNEDREAIVVGAGLCNSEIERAYTAYAPHYEISGVGGSRSKERDRKSELVLRSTYQSFEWDRNNSDRNFYNVVRYVHIPLVPWMQERSKAERRTI